MISSETVNPTPARAAMPVRSIQLNEGFSSAEVSLVVTQEPPAMPTVLPRTRPAMMPSAAVSPNTVPRPPSMATPADISANTGSTSPEDQGLSRCSTRWLGDCASPASGTVRMSSPRATPAMVACTPLACTSAQTAQASGR